jgi:hypothetical protein
MIHFGFRMGREDVWVLEGSGSAEIPCGESGGGRDGCRDGRRVRVRRERGGNLLIVVALGIQFVFGRSFVKGIAQFCNQKILMVHLK